MMNRVILIGNLGADPEMRMTSNGNAQCSLRVATTEKFKDKTGAWKKHTEWHRVVVWGNQAEACGRYLRKGRGVAVEGRIKTRKFEQDGVSRFITEISAEIVHFMSDSDRGTESDEPVEKHRRPATQMELAEPGSDDEVDEDNV